MPTVAGKVSSYPGGPPTVQEVFGMAHIEWASRPTGLVTGITIYTFKSRNDNSCPIQSTMMIEPYAIIVPMVPVFSDFDPLAMLIRIIITHLLSSNNYKDCSYDT